MTTSRPRAMWSTRHDQGEAEDSVCYAGTWASGANRMAVAPNAPGGHVIQMTEDSDLHGVCVYGDKYREEIEPIRAIGHLHEAEDESQEFGALHAAIRAARKAFQTEGAMPDWEALAQGGERRQASDPPRGAVRSGGRAVVRRRRRIGNNGPGASGQERAGRFMLLRREGVVRSLSNCARAASRRIADHEGMYLFSV